MYIPTHGQTQPFENRVNFKVLIKKHLEDTEKEEENIYVLPRVLPLKDSHY